MKRYTDKLTTEEQSYYAMRHDQVLGYLLAIESECDRVENLMALMQYYKSYTKDQAEYIQEVYNEELSEEAIQQYYEDNIKSITKQ